MADLNESANGSTITLAVGESRSVVLGERPTTGFRWHPTVSDGAVAAIAATSFRPRSLDPGGGGERVFTISALSVGTATLTWAHQRGAGPDAVLDRRITLTLHVN